MIVNKDSWHYQVVRFETYPTDPPPSNLCKYFWTFVAKFLGFGAMFTGLALLGLVVSLFGLCVLADPWFYLAAALLYPDLEITQTLVGYLFKSDIGGPVSWICYGIPIIMYGLLSCVGYSVWKQSTDTGKKYQAYLNNRKHSRSLQVEEGTGVYGVIIGFLIAKKQKVCPTIKYVNPKVNNG